MSRAAQQTLMPPEPTTAAGEHPGAAIVPTNDANDMIGMIERLARDVDVDKLERLIGMQERVMAHNAKAAFDAAFAEMQGDLPVISERGRIVVNKEERSKYARYEDIIEVVRPILKQHGFSLRHQNRVTGEGKDKTLKIVAILSHRQGHREEDEFECPPDASGGKNDIQARGSTRSYGERYTTISILGIVTRGTDDDGRAAGKAAPTEPPPGFAEWFANLAETADDGAAALFAAFNKGDVACRKYLTREQNDDWEALKALASKAGK